MGNTKNYKMIISYDGTRYYGWEHQPNTDMTIQGKLENVLSQMIGADVEVIGAGRTDAGVHAKGMAANVHMDTDMSENQICDYICQRIYVCRRSGLLLNVSTADIMLWGKLIVIHAMLGIKNPCLTENTYI